MCVYSITVMSYVCVVLVWIVIFEQYINGLEEDCSISNALI